MKIGSLFSGIGGLDLAVEQYIGGRVVWQVENDPYPSIVLARHWPGVPNLGDITEVNWSDVEPVDILCGGFPCQDISQAGKGAGIVEGKTRSGLWFNYAAAIGALRPQLVIVENVRRLVTRGLDIVLGSLAEVGYDAQWCVVRASDVGAPHRRERIFIAAYPSSERLRAEAGNQVERQDSTGPTSWLSGSGHKTATYASGGESERRGVAGQLAGEGRPAEDQAQERQRGRDAVGGGGQVDAYPNSGGREIQLQQHGHSAQTVEGPLGHDADGRHEDVADTDRASWGQSWGSGETVCEPSEIERSGRCDEVAWGPFSDAIRRWEQLTRPAPEPTVAGRLNPSFVEWMMGYPSGWVDGLSRTRALKALGNAVVPQQVLWGLELLNPLGVGQLVLA